MTKPMHEWTDEEIKDYYDQNPNMLLTTYAGMLGLSVGELKDILTSSPLEEYNEPDLGEWWSR